MLATVSLAAAACSTSPPPLVPVQVNFDSDPRIMRGSWAGTTCTAAASTTSCASGTITLNLTATYVSETKYLTGGTVSLDGGPNLTLSGEYSGALYRYVRAQPQTWPPFNLAQGTIKNADGGHLYDFEFKTYGGDYQGRLFRPGQTSDADLLVRNLARTN